MFGICGDNCTCCPRYIATQKGSIDELETVKELWLLLGLRDPDFPAEGMICNGCRPENKCAYQKLRSCVTARKIKNCGFCDEYPCKFIKEVFDKTEKLRLRAEKVCTREEIDLLNKAFFMKKQFFNRIHEKQ
jgi:hypothetical protein